MIIKRGDILLINLEPAYGSEQGKTRPCLVVQNDISNKYSPNTIIVPFTSAISNKNYPTVVIAEQKESGLQKTSAILCTQVRTISVKERVVKKLSTLNSASMKKVDKALKISLGLE